MTLNVALSPEVECLLKSRAMAEGIDESTCAARLLERKLREPESLREISGELQERFAQSGMSDAELGEILEQEKHAARAARRGVAISE